MDDYTKEFDPVNTPEAETPAEEVSSVEETVTEAPAVEETAAEVPAEQTVKKPVRKTEQPRNERRSRKSKQEIFKESTLPVIILGVSALLILIFIVGSVTRAIQKKNIEEEYSIAVSESIAEVVRV